MAEKIAKSKGVAEVGEAKPVKIDMRRAAPILKSLGAFGHGAEIEEHLLCGAHGPVIGIRILGNKNRALVCPKCVLDFAKLTKQVA